MKKWKEIFAEKVASMRLMDPWVFQEDDCLELHNLKPGWREFLQNHASGRFQCSQCLYKWSSARVHILFHMCYGMVLMRIFRQACKYCHEPQLEKPIFSLENIERLLHNLVLKILEDFYNVPMQLSDLLEVVVDGCHATGPHDKTHCEGCRLGVCSRPRAAVESGAGKNKVGVSKAQKIKMDVGNFQKTKTGTKKAWKPRKDGEKAFLITRSPQQVTGGGFPWKRCCCVGFSVLCVLAVLLFVLLYFLRKQ